MIVAVMDRNGYVKGHFGREEQMRLYLVENGEVVMEKLYSLQGSGYSAMNELLSLRVSVVLADSITPACSIVLRDNDVKCFTGVQGKVEDALADFLADKLVPSEESSCSGSCSACATKCH